MLEDFSIYYNGKLGETREVRFIEWRLVEAGEIM
jgi:hypothetical protein